MHKATTKTMWKTVRREIVLYDSTKSNICIIIYLDVYGIFGSIFSFFQNNLYFIIHALQELRCCDKQFEKSKI